MTKTIYAIKDTQLDKVIYVGSTNNMAHRIAQYRNFGKGEYNHTGIYKDLKDMSKHTNFDFITLAEEVEDYKAMENFFMDLYDTYKRAGRYNKRRAI